MKMGTDWEEADFATRVVAVDRRGREHVRLEKGTCWNLGVVDRVLGMCLTAGRFESGGFFVGLHVDDDGGRARLLGAVDRFIAVAQVARRARDRFIRVFSASSSEVFRG